MSGLAGIKLSCSDLRKILAEVWQYRIEPKIIETKVQCDMFNKREKLTARILGLQVIHEWKVGDRFYELPIKVKEEDNSFIAQAALGMGQEGLKEVDEKPEVSKPVRKKRKNVSKVDGKLKRKSNKNWKVIKDD